MLVTLDGFVTDFVVTPANIDDRDGVWDLLDSFEAITLIGDKGYIGTDFANSLKKEKGISLLPLKRNNSKAQFSKDLRRIIFKLRRRIETSGSQLTEQLNIERVRAKSLWDLITRIKTKLLAHNLCYFINMLMGKNINCSKIKHLVFG